MCSVAGALSFLDVLTASFARGKNVAPASAVDHHRARDRHLRDDDIFCLEERRIVSADYVVQYHGRALQLDRAARGRVPAKSTVLVRETEEGTLRVVHIGRDGEPHRCAWTPAVARAVPPVLLPVAVAPCPIPAAVYHVSPDHPWHRQHGQWIAKAKQRRLVRARR